MLLTAAAALGSAAIAAVAVLLPAYLHQDGYSLAWAAAVTGGLGVAQVLGRVILTLHARRMPVAAAAAVMLAVQAAGVAGLLLIGGPVGVGVFLVLFGPGFGVLSIARPDLLARYAPRPVFARLSGVQALLVTGAEAAGPLAATGLRAVTGSYTPVFAGVAAASLATAVLLVAAEWACCPGDLPIAGRRRGASRALGRWGYRRPARWRYGPVPVSPAAG